jgi:hypothetical protein
VLTSTPQFHLRPEGLICVIEILHVRFGQPGPLQAMPSPFLEFYSESGQKVPSRAEIQAILGHIAGQAWRRFLPFTSRFKLAAELAD